MPHLIRESVAGQLLNYISSGRLLPYSDQLEGYQVPARYLKGPLPSPVPETPESVDAPSGTNTLVDVPTSSVAPKEGSGAPASTEIDLEKGKSEAGQAEEATGYPFLVEWEENDPDYPL